MREDPISLAAPDHTLEWKSHSFVETSATRSCHSSLSIKAMVTTGARLSIASTTSDGVLASSLVLFACCTLQTFEFR
ncbi:unnamed protein product [Protopolystoma xenopodis]|uniref:Uncharacterized protein n=1 Tax=Protopolystoma xenopodis TaxID=117903 RepID=A0A448WVN7_9PLAT|nr:unnamed protein product [Protopolystoma xenopodis]